MDGAGGTSKFDIEPTAVIYDFNNLTTPTGLPNTGGGFYFRTRDMVKFGQLMLDGGTWNDYNQDFDSNGSYAGATAWAAFDLLADDPSNPGQPDPTTNGVIVRSGMSVTPPGPGGPDVP